MFKLATASTPSSQTLGGINSGLSRRTGSIAEVKQLQAHMAECALSKDTPVRFKAGLSRAYVDLDEIAMAKQGIGRPKPVEARNAQPKRKAPRVIAPLRPAPPAAPTPGPAEPPTAA